MEASSSGVSFLISYGSSAVERLLWMAECVRPTQTDSRSLVRLQPGRIFRSVIGSTEAFGAFSFGSSPDERIYCR